MDFRQLLKKLQPQLRIQVLKRHLQTANTKNAANGYARKAVFGVVASTSVYLCWSQLSKSPYLAYEEKQKKKLVILGSGWGAVSLLKNIQPDLYDITVVSPTNYFLFTPLLPSVTVGTVDGRSLLEPVRKILSKKHKLDAQFIEAECTDVDIEKQKVTCMDKTNIKGSQSSFEIDYDVLVVAVGSKTATYNKEDIEKYAHKLKSVTQAREIRCNIIDSFETAAIPGQPEEEIKRLLNFVVVGGGPTGVEFASELRDFIHDLKKLYKDDLVEKVTVTLVNSNYKMLSMFDEQICQYTADHFKSSGIDVISGSYVVGIDEKEIQIKSKATKEVTAMPYGMCVWAAGIQPRSLTKKLIAAIPNQNNRNALAVDCFLKVKNCNNVFAIGDCGTIRFDKMLSDVEKLFKEADNDGSCALSLDEFAVFLEDAKTKYPAMTQHLSKMQRKISKVFALADRDKDGSLSMEEFSHFLKETDNKLTSHPATAQVASQEGKYLAKLLSKHPEVCDNDFSSSSAFVYNHLGSFCYVGGEKAVLTMPIVGSMSGWFTMWLWRGAYLNEAVSFRMQCMIAVDWLKAHVFGRDTSRIA